MGKIIGDTACPQCRENGRDKTGNHLILFADGGAKCSRDYCGYYTAKYVEGEVVTSHKSDKEEKMSLSDVEELKFTKLPSRKISLETAKKYGVKTSVNPATGEIDSSGII